MADDTVLPAALPAECFRLLEYLGAPTQFPLAFLIDLPPELARQDVLDLCEYHGLIGFGGGPPRGMPLVEFRAEDNKDPRLPPRGTIVKGAVAPGTKMTVALTNRGRACLAERSLAGEDTECFVTLQQAAAIVSRSKRTLEKYKTKMPLPRVAGGGGKPDEWAWSEIRPWLEEKFGRKLSDRFPADRLPNADRN